MKTQLTYILILLLGLVSCDQDSRLEVKPFAELKSEVVEADNAFGMDVFKLIHDGEEEENFMISPLSISMALSMAYNGAETETKVEMEEALRKAGVGKDVINQSYGELVETLSTIDPKVAMEVANSIWYRDTYSVEESFLEVNRKFYDAEVKEADFNNAATLDLINGWVKEKTHDKIQSIIDQITPETVMYIINAIYFNGSWTQEFNPENTQEGLFRLENDEYVQTDLMQRLDTLDYLKNDVFSAVQLPYGEGNFNMMLMLPNADKQVADVVEMLDAENWKNWQEEFEETKDVDILLPKFKIEYKKSLKTILQSMGMYEAFTTDADFSGINPNRDLFISEVLHKTFIEVDEEGTEAAAVTAIVFENTSIDPNKPQKVYFHCNKPFLFAITEKETGAVLFMGKLGNPISEE